METDDELKVIGLSELKNEYNLTDKQIAVMDREAQSIMGNSLCMIDGALRDEENKPMERIATALTFIDMTMGMIEKNFNETISKNLTKEELN